MKIFYLGPEGTFSHRVAKKIQKDTDTLVACDTLASIPQLLGDTDYGILPLENSTSCNVHESFDLILENKLSIVAEVYLEISFSLFGKTERNIENINTVYAHPMAAKQCQKLLSELNCTVVTANSNLAASDLLKKDTNNDSAAIAPKDIEVPELDCLQSDIADSKHNYTRFVIVSNKSQVSNGANKVTAVVKVKHQPGALAKVLTAVAETNLNLTKIESRAIPGTDWEYLFWLDIVLNDTPLEELQSLLSSYVDYQEIIGYYPKG